ncbi:hypothetical protein OG792_19110 [Micromonospora sp. NBC_01699]|uniref:hypothetical protein n=1 Tax=Micromonospora sp. NBC_01699 TaxID=2975984 RepID=UPI002E28C2FA|nr:hypothetical protein [Micromonospora sp. NBC_01699]
MNVSATSGQKGRGFRTLLLQGTLAVAMLFAAAMIASPAQAGVDGTHKVAPTSGTQAGVAAPAATPNGATVLGKDSVVKPNWAYSYTLYYTPPNFVEAYITVTSGYVLFGVFCDGYGWVYVGWLPVGSWYAWVNCGSYTATQYQFIGSD